MSLPAFPQSFHPFIIASIQRHCRGRGKGGERERERENEKRAKHTFDLPVVPDHNLVLIAVRGRFRLRFDPDRALARGQQKILFEPRMKAI